ncbi:hypothetical protein GJU39_09885 [Pedobacter petrophilus]|uniref:Uncharacterized protein n=1 Tax=Pedobacter petrophilus TaxID=1908241 RepID=A0A7K0FXS7_9SPHI|nr:hypothetical protein [Pedobacter petrophilus]MRX76398.1 hypothetical protein [Pedobacter petrophilus]
MKPVKAPGISSPLVSTNGIRSDLNKPSLKVPPDQAACNEFRFKAPGISSTLVSTNGIHCDLNKASIKAQPDQASCNESN